MIGRLCILSFLLAAGAGCLGGDSTDGTTGTSDSTSGTRGASTDPSVPEATDTLRFLVAPGMTTSPPNGTEAGRTVVTYRGGLEPSEGATWNYTLQGGGVLGPYEATVWIRVTETLVIQADRGSECVWEFTVTVASPGGTPKPYAATCSPPYGPSIPPGDYELAFHSQGPSQGGADTGSGTALQFTLRRYAFSASPNDAVFALSGTKEFDSRVMFPGLAEPAGPSA